MPVNAFTAPKRLLVVLPTWVGDMVMATPTLRALREHLPQTHITLLTRAYAKEVILSSPWHDRLMTIRRRRPADAKASRQVNRRRSQKELIGRLRRGQFDTVIMLRNSFGTAMLAKAAGIPRRIGYDRDARGWLLTDRLLPIKSNGRYIPVPAVNYYLALARYMGAEPSKLDLELFSRPQDDALIIQKFIKAGLPNPTDPNKSGPIIMLNPGSANKGAAKLWPADRFAKLADHLIEKHNASIILGGAPKEKPILDEVQKHAHHPLTALPTLGCSLRLLKSVAKYCDLAVTNDTGPRHIAAAMGTPVVSLFGPTEPRWTEIPFEHETLIHLDHSMLTIPVDMVIDKADAALAGQPSEHITPEHLTGLHDSETRKNTRHAGV